MVTVIQPGFRPHTHPRSEIPDLFDVPFWSKIPDKPSQFPPEPHSHSRSEITDLFTAPFWDLIPDKPEALPAEPHTHTRDEITDLFNAPFWDLIPDKPSQFPPESHTHDRVEITGLFLPPFWEYIPDKPSVFPPEPHHASHEPGGSDEIEYFLMPLNVYHIDTTEKFSSIGSVTLYSGEKLLGRIFGGSGMVIVYPDDDLIAPLTPDYVNEDLSNEPKIRDHDDDSGAYPDGLGIDGFSEATLIRYDLGELMNVFIRLRVKTFWSTFVFRLYVSPDSSSWNQISPDIDGSGKTLEYIFRASNVRYVEIRAYNTQSTRRVYDSGQTYEGILALEAFRDFTQGNYIVKPIESDITGELRVIADQTPFVAKVIEVADFKLV